MPSVRYSRSNHPGGLDCEYVNTYTTIKTIQREKSTTEQYSPAVTAWDRTATTSIHVLLCENDCIQNKRKITIFSSYEIILLYNHIALVLGAQLSMNNVHNPLQYKHMPLWEWLISGLICYLLPTGNVRNLTYRDTDLCVRFIRTNIFSRVSEVKDIWRYVRLIEYRRYVILILCSLYAIISRNSC